jgi:hypothetical protein
MSERKEIKGTFWRDFPAKYYEWPKGTIIIEYLNDKGEVVLSQPCFIMCNFWEGIEKWADEANIEAGMRALFGE